MPDAQFCFIVGADALADMPHWHEAERIFELATVCVAGRPGEDEGSAMFGNRVTALAMPEIEISSTDIRERVRAGKSIRYMVPELVLDYIRGQRLYAG